MSSDIKILEKGTLCNMYCFSLKVLKNRMLYIFCKILTKYKFELQARGDESTAVIVFFIYS
jgi:transposase